MRIIVDGDGCPVKNECLIIARNYQIPVIIVTSFAHFTRKESDYPVEYIYVDKENQMADYRIYSILNADDILITQDYGLAAMALNKAKVMHHSGKEYTKDNIDQLLNERYLNQKARLAKMKTGKIKPFTEKDKLTFEIYFNNFIKDRISHENRRS